ncbi:hypothetical protein [Streptomyces sp. ODS05-4]|uniref:hypothetical protein n=1 Tax=Streptomyces sp. ODS05-4 TaxID=2944939 RepID=UPI00210AC1C5|nr:hypothetical protein [Streptomyces sp. ODS05-4]
MPVVPAATRAGRLLLAAAVGAGLLLAGCAPPPAARAAKPAPPAAGPPRPAPARIPGLGPSTSSRIPDGTSQAVVVTGDGPDSPQSTVVLYERDPAAGWRAVSQSWPAHNALRGWSANHRAGDLRSPIGVYTLSDAGGRLPDPGTRLPYDQSEFFNMPEEAEGFLGETLVGSFDYVVAVDYNRVPGNTPLDKRRPLGDDAGGGVWIHVDHGGPTKACVSMAEEHLRRLLVALDPARAPVVVMGDAGTLGR